MKKKIILTLFAANLYLASSAQEKFGNTLNLGVGIGYYRYTNHPVTVLTANYEIDAAKNFTLAPSIGFYSYNEDYYWGNSKYPYRFYHYHQTVVPIGIKGTYYFNKLLKADSKWDFYAAGSLGIAIIRSHWEDGYFGDKSIYRNAYQGSTPVFLDLHIGSEFHMNDKIGLFLDLSTGVSTFGLAIH